MGSLDLRARQALGSCHSPSVFGATRAMLLAGSYADVMAISFRDQSMVIRDSGTPANNFLGNPNSKLTITSPSTKEIIGSNGFYQSGSGLRTAYNSSGVALGTWFEETRTNTCLHCRDFTQTGAGAWVYDNSGGSLPVVTANYALAPDGTMTASRLQLDKTGGVFSRIRSANTTGTIAETWTSSIWMKSNTGASQNVGLRMSASGSSNNVVTTSWQRFQLTAVLVDTSNVIEILLFDTIPGNDETADILIWHAQCEKGARATSPITTTTVAVTRNTDLVSLATSLFPYSATEGVFRVSAYIEPDIDGASGNYYFSLSDGTVANTLHVMEANGTQGQVIAASATTFNSTVGAEPATGTIVTMALGYKATATQLAVDGAAGTEDVAVTIPTVTTLKLGIRGDDNALASLNGIIRDIIYRPVKPGTAELTAMSLETYTP